MNNLQQILDMWKTDSIIDEMNLIGCGDYNDRAEVSTIVDAALSF